MLPVSHAGVAIAFPRAHFEVVDVDITRVSDTRTWGQPPQDDAPEHTSFGALEFLMRLAGRGAKRRREEDVPGSSGVDHGKAEEDHWQVRAELPAIELVPRDATENIPATREVSQRSMGVSASGDDCLCYSWYLPWHTAEGIASVRGAR